MLEHRRGAQTQEGAALPYGHAEHERPWSEEAEQAAGPMGNAGWCEGKEGPGLGGSLGKVEGWKRPLGQQRFRKSHSLSIGLFSYTLHGYKERLNVQQMSFSLHLFVLIDKSLFCVGQFDHLLNLSFLLSCHGNVLECPEFIFLFYLILWQYFSILYDISLKATILYFYSYFS